MENQFCEEYQSDLRIVFKVIFLWHSLLNLSISEFIYVTFTLLY